MKLQHWFGLCAVLATGLLLWSLREVLIHLFAAIVLAMALCTLVGALRQRWNLPRPLALLVCIAGLVVMVSVGLTVIVPPFTSQFQQLILQLPSAAKALKDLLLQAFSSVSSMVYGNGSSSTWSQLLFPKGLADSPGGPALASSLTGGLLGLLGLAGNVGSGLLQLLIVFAVTLMVAVQPHAYKNVGIQLLPSFYRRRARVILNMCGDALSNWMIGVLISSVCVAVLAGIGLSLMGVKLVMANALLAGLLNVIPNVGPTLSTVFPMSVALLDAPWKALAVLGLYIFIQNMESYVITPSVMQRQVNLLPGLTLAAQLIFTVLFGPLGLLLALPLAVVLQVLIREVVVHDLLDPLEAAEIDLMNARTLLIALTSILLTLLLWQLRWVLLILFGAVVLAVTLDVPILKLMERFRLQRPVALLVVLVVLFLGGTLVVQLLLPELLGQFEQLTALLPNLIDKIRSIIASQPSLSDLNISPSESLSWTGIQPVGAQLLGYAGGAANGLIQVLLMSLLAILLALDPKSHRQMLIAVSPRPARAQVTKLLDRCRDALGGWLAGMTISATAVFVLTWTGLAILGVPLALLSGLVCGLLTFVPTIGPTAATLLPMGIALLISPTLMLQVLVLRLALQNLEAFVLTPVLLSRTVNLLPTVALTAQLSLGALLGLPGVLLALPLVVVLQVIMQQVVIKQIMDRWELSPVLPSRAAELKGSSVTVENR